MAATATGQFATAQAVRDWIEDLCGVVYSVGSLYILLPRLGIRLKMPRPRHTGGFPGSGGLEKRGLGAHLAAVGLKAVQGIVCGDEMCVGLRGQMRKVWVPRGMSVSQAVQIGWSYTYVAVALDPRTGVWVWNGAWGHKGGGHAGHQGTPGRATALRPRIKPGGVLRGVAPSPGEVTCRSSRRHWNQSWRPGRPTLVQ